MAAFYAYRHVELDRVGCGKRKVLKPPGGGSSDIFGTSSTNEESPRKVKNYMASHLPIGEYENDERKIDSTDGTCTPSQSTGSNGTPNSSGPNTPRSGTPLLNSPIAYNTDLPTPSRPRGRRLQGNPVTGEGYDGDKKEDTPRRQRVPPGGYSSKLW